jgi:hypothetical protein
MDPVMQNAQCKMQIDGSVSAFRILHYAFCIVTVHSALCILHYAFCIVHSALCISHFYS